MLSLLHIIVPILSAVVVLMASERWSGLVAKISALLSVVVTVICRLTFLPGEEWQHVFKTSWMQQPEIQLYFGMDGVSWLMLLLSNLATVAAVFTVSQRTIARSDVFLALLLLLNAAMNGVFLSLDLLVYYIFWELSLVPACILLLRYGMGNSMKVTLKFFLYTLAGSLCMLIAILWLGFHGTIDSFSFEYVSSLSLSANTQTFLLVCFMLAYAVKLPVFPFHTWQQETYASSPIPLTMLLSGVMLKMALYSMVRWLYPITPDALQSSGQIFLWLSVTGVAYASFIAWRQENIKKLFAWASMAHVGLMAAGILTMSRVGVSGALLQMVAHTINAISVLFIVHLLNKWKHSDKISEFGGLRRSNPLLGGLFLWFMFSFIAVPLTAGFPGELMLLISVFKWNVWSGVLAGISVILGAVYMIRSYQRLMLGADLQNDTSSEGTNILLTNMDRIMLFTFAFLILWIGLFPQTILDWIDDSVLHTFQSHIPKL
jgi:NADH-quinone oxidoreductase subunit M